MLFTRRRRGIGLTGIVLIIALLYFTGAGKWLWHQVMQAEGECYNVMAQMGTDTGTPVCIAIGKGVRAIDGLTSDLDVKAQGIKDWFKDMMADHDLSSVVGKIRVPRSLQEFGSSSADLNHYMSFGPGGMPTGTSATDQLRNAIDSFQIGTGLMEGAGNSVRNAVPWLQQGASNGSYGLLSQLSLGDIYREGRGDVPANPQMAASYYSSAYRSIDALQANNSPAAQQILATLPASPQAIQQQLVQVVKQLKPQR